MFHVEHAVACRDREDCSTWNNASAGGGIVQFSAIDIFKACYNTKAHE